MIRELVIPKPIWVKMRRHAHRYAPLEACGLLAGRDGKVIFSQGIRSDARSPVRFTMNPKGQLRAFERMDELGLELLGIYHSHPSGHRQPSASDIQQALYPVVQVIWFRQDGKWQADGFWIESRQVSRVRLQVAS